MIDGRRDQSKDLLYLLPIFSLPIKSVNSQRSRSRRAHQDMKIDITIKSKDPSSLWRKKRGNIRPAFSRLEERIGFWFSALSSHPPFLLLLPPSPLSTPTALLVFARRRPFFLNHSLFLHFPLGIVWVSFPDWTHQQLQSNCPESIPIPIAQMASNTNGPLYGRPPFATDVPDHAYDNTFNEQHRRLRPQREEPRPTSAYNV